MRLKLDQIRTLLPELEELRPVLDLLMAASEPDAQRAWAGSEELGTFGSRLVDGSLLAESSAALAQRAHDKAQALYGVLGRAVDRLSQGDQAGAAAALLDAAAIEEASSRPDRAAAYASAAYRTARDLRDQVPAALALRRWARATRAQGRLDDAAQRYSTAYQIALDSSDAPGAAESAIGAGNVLEEQGRWNEAEGWYRSALEALSDIEGPVRERWQAMLNLHIVLRSRGDLEGSLEWLERAQRMAEELGEDGAAPYLRNAWGQFHMASGDAGEAEAQLRRALEVSTHTAATVTVRLNLAEVLLAQARTLEATELTREAEREALSTGLVSRLPEAYRLLGRIAASQRNPDAFVFFERALEVIRERTLPALEEALTLQAYAEAESGRGEEEAAQQLQERARERYASIGIEHLRHPWADYFAPPAADQEPSPEKGQKE
jgi:tetratricopeptide (TPR) repeat protein